MTLWNEPEKVRDAGHRDQNEIVLRTFRVHGQHLSQPDCAWCFSPQGVPAPIDWTGFCDLGGPLQGISVTDFNG